MPKDDTARAARLAEALRVNLRRRKAQARAQDGESIAGGPTTADPKAEPSAP